MSCDLSLFVCISLSLCLDRAPGCSVVSLPKQKDSIINQANLVPVCKKPCSSRCFFPLKFPYSVFHCENLPTGTIFHIRRGSTWAERTLKRPKAHFSQLNSDVAVHVIKVSLNLLGKRFKSLSKIYRLTFHTMTAHMRHILIWLLWALFYILSAGSLTVRIVKMHR